MDLPNLFEGVTQREFLAWAAAVGPGIAALVPLVFFLVERRDRKAAETRRDTAESERHDVEDRYRSELLERQRARDDERLRAQADLFHIWVENTTLTVSNASRMPVSNVVCAFKTFVSEGERSRELQQTVGLGLVPPTGGRFIEHDFIETSIRAGAPRVKSISPYLETVTFTDAHGRRWRRTLPDWNLEAVEAS